MLVEVEDLFMAHCDGGSLLCPQMEKIVAICLMTKANCNILMLPLRLVLVNILKVIVIPKEVLHH